MKQKKISMWLKGMCIGLILAIMAFFVWKIAFQIAVYTSEGFFGWNRYAGLALSCMVGMISLLILRRFWKVCTEIGNDNSFSLENVENFHKMTIMGVVCFAQYLVRVVICMITDISDIRRLAVLGILVLLTVVFTILCEALSQLIRNAYEVKHENDLTI